MFSEYTQEELQAYSDAVGQYLDQAVYIFNEQYGTATDPEELNNFALLYLVAVLYGTSKALSIPGSKGNKDIIKKYFDDGYKGVNATSTREFASLAKGKQLSKQQIQEFLAKRGVEINEGLRTGVVQLTQMKLAEGAGFSFVGAISRMDARVRPTHKEHNYKVWSMSASYEPMFDFGCRCTYRYFTSLKEAEEAGYNPL